MARIPKEKFSLENLSNLGGSETKKKEEQELKKREEQRKQYEENRERRKWLAEEKERMGIKTAEDITQEEKVKRMRKDILGLGKKTETELREEKELRELAERHMFRAKEGGTEQPFDDIEDEWFRRGETESKDLEEIYQNTLSAERLEKMAKEAQDAAAGKYMMNMWEELSENLKRYRGLLTPQIEKNMRTAKKAEREGNDTARKRAVEPVNEHITGLIKEYITRNNMMTDVLGRKGEHADILDRFSEEAMGEGYYHAESLDNKGIFGGLKRMWKEFRIKSKLNKDQRQEFKKAKLSYRGYENGYKMLEEKQGKRFGKLERAVEQYTGIGSDRMHDTVLRARLAGGMERHYGIKTR